MILWLALFFLAIGVTNALFWPRVRKATALAAGGLTVCIPARNEEANLAACLSSVLSQRSVTEVLVYDDHSTDSTAAIAEANCDPRVKLLQPVALPSAGLEKPLPVGNWLERQQHAGSCSWMQMRAWRQKLAIACYLKSNAGA